MNDKKVLVVGAAGLLGSKITKALLERGADVTAMIRTTSNRSNLQEMGVKNFAVGDMLDKQSLRNALSSKPAFDAIVSSAAGYTRHSKGDSFKTDTLGYKNLVDATKEAGIPRFVFISILECDKAVNVPHFYNKYLIEKYLAERHQPFIALRPGAFLDQAGDILLHKISEGIFPVFFDGVDYGTICTADLARYVAIAATSLPNSELNSIVDVGWSTPVNSKSLAATFKKVLRKPIRTKPFIPSFVVKIIVPIMATFNSSVKDMLEMIKWVNTGAYVSSNTKRQMELFGDLPTMEEAVTRFCKDKGFLTD